MTARLPAHAILLVGAITGLMLRLLARDYTTPDTYGFLFPWYDLARDHGIDSLRLGLTNYAPFYSYLLLLAVQLDGLAPPLLLVKAISFLFEFANAVIANRLVQLAAPSSSTKPALAFAAVWLAPSALYNGALWGQADSIWTFFVLLSVLLVCTQRLRMAVVAFAVAVSVKAHAIFLGPFIFALVLRGRVHWLWLMALPATYVVLALPVLLLGRPPWDVLTIYLEQARYFRALSMNAPNLWLFVPDEFYWPGLAVGLALSCGVGLAYAIGVARLALYGPISIMLAATASLQLMPWILPKMHDRYFYAFEISMIVLAFMEPRLAILAVIAQFDAVATYFSFDGGAALGAPIAALLNTLVLVSLQLRLWTGTFDGESFARQFRPVVLTFLLWCGVVIFSLPKAHAAHWWPIDRADWTGLALYIIALSAAIALQRRLLP